MSEYTLFLWLPEWRNSSDNNPEELGHLRHARAHRANKTRTAQAKHNGNLSGNVKLRAVQKGSKWGANSEESSKQYSPREVFVRGVLMGLAELVPGVSGGTIAFISGIYYQLVSALSSFGPLSFKLAMQPRQFWLHHHLGFLLALVVGMVAGILVFARLIEFMMEAAEPVLWAFFFGLLPSRCYKLVLLARRAISPPMAPSACWRVCFFEPTQH